MQVFILGGVDPLEVISDLSSGASYLLMLLGKENSKAATSLRGNTSFSYSVPANIYVPGESSNEPVVKLDYSSIKRIKLYYYMTASAEHRKTQKPSYDWQGNLTGYYDTWDDMDYESIHVGIRILKDFSNNSVYADSINCGGHNVYKMTDTLSKESYVDIAVNGVKNLTTFCLLQFTVNCGCGWSNGQIIYSGNYYANASCTLLYKITEVEMMDGTLYRG